MPRGDVSEEKREVARIRAVARGDDWVVFGPWRADVPPGAVNEDIHRFELVETWAVGGSRTFIKRTAHVMQWHVTDELDIVEREHSRENAGREGETEAVLQARLHKTSVALARLLCAEADCERGVRMLKLPNFDSAEAAFARVLKFMDAFEDAKQKHAETVELVAESGRLRPGGAAS